MNLAHLSRQCAIPVFEGLLPPRENKIVLTLLYRLAEWHALAKLHMHTEPTLAHLDKATVVLGNELRRFRDKVCPSYDTVELPREEDAHYRREAKKAASFAAGPDTTISSAPGLPVTSHTDQPAPSASAPYTAIVSHPTAATPSSVAGGAPASSHSDELAPSASAPYVTTTHPITTMFSATGAPATSPAKEPKKEKEKGKRRKWFSLLTYKAHALGDYVRSIHWFGPSGSFSSQPVSPRLSNLRSVIF